MVMFDGLFNKFSQALAQKLDDDIIYGCDSNAIRWHNAQRVLELNDSSHMWIPRFLWKHILKGIVIH